MESHHFRRHVPVPSFIPDRTANDANKNFDAQENGSPERFIPAPPKRAQSDVAPVANAVNSLLPDLSVYDLTVGETLEVFAQQQRKWDNDHCFPGQETLAKDMGSGLRSVARYIKELEKEKFLKVKKLGQGRVNLYELNLTVPKGGRAGRS